jgi:polysaccharide biosynthesis protein PslG
MKKVYYFVSIFMLIMSFFTPQTASASTRYETGISTGASIIWMDDENLEKRLHDIKDLGATWIRVDFNWAIIQPKNGTEYDWSKYDRLVRAADAHQLKILTVVGYTPQWARESACQLAARSQRCAPRSNTEFARFVGTAAKRYSKQSVRGWEIWNEPNLVAYWKTTQPDGSQFVDPVAYGQLANAAAKEIRKYTDGVIITGGLSPLFEPSRSTGMRQSDFLASVLPYLNHNLFSGIAIHPYTWPVLPSRKASFNAFYTVDNDEEKYNLRTIMESAGWNDKQIWGTEYGASTIGTSTSTQITAKNRPDHVTEQVQAQIISIGMAKWYKKQNVGPLFVHSDSDQWLGTSKNEGGFGLKRSDDTKKPAYDALKTATASIKK